MECGLVLCEVYLVGDDVGRALAGDGGAAREREKEGEKRRAVIENRVGCPSVHTAAGGTKHDSAAIGRTRGAREQPGRRPEGRGTGGQDRRGVGGEPAERPDSGNDEARHRRAGDGGTADGGPRGFDGSANGPARAVTEPKRQSRSRSGSGQWKPVQITASL